MTTLAKDTVGKLPESTRDPVTWDDLVGRITRLFEITNEHWDRMEGGDEAHRDLMARVARCEARLDGRGQEVARDLSPAEAMDAMADLVRTDAPPHPSDWSQYNEWLETPPKPAPASPEDPEGLPVIKGAAWDNRDGGVAMGAHLPGGHRWGGLVRLSDAVEKIDRLAARLEEAERERDEARISAGALRQDADLFRTQRDNALGESERLRQRLEGMVVTEGMVEEADVAARGFQSRADHINRALRGEGGGDE